MEERKTYSITNYNSRKPTSHIPAGFSLEPNKIINSNIQASSSRSPKAKDSVKQQASEEWNGDNGKVEGEEPVVEEPGRERLKRHREEVAGQVRIPDKWGQEQLLKDWIDYTTFDALLAPHRMIVTARDALVADARKARSQRLRIHGSC